MNCPYCLKQPQAKIQNAKKELSLLSLKQQQAKISIVVKNYRKQETDILH